MGVRPAIVASTAIGLALIACAALPSFAGATYPGANGLIAYVAPPTYTPASTELYTIAPDGSDLRRLTNDPHQQDQPAWSPDGTRLVFTARGAGKRAAIVTANPDGTDMRVIARSRARKPTPSFSESARRVLFTTGRTLVTVRADGAGARRVIAHASRPGALRDPALSPDGLWIAFAGRPGRGAKQGIWRMRRDGTHMRLLSREFGDVQDPDFSPDGRWIVFWTYESGIRLMRANGKHEQDLSPDGFGLLGWPAFSPAGDRIVFTDLTRPGRGTHGCSDLYTISPDGADLRRVTYYSSGPIINACGYPYGDVSGDLNAIGAAWQPAVAADGRNAP